MCARPAPYGMRMVSLRQSNQSHYQMLFGQIEFGPCSIEKVSHDAHLHLAMDRGGIVEWARDH
jgi:hypothetical protein